MAPSAFVYLHDKSRGFGECCVFHLERSLAGSRWARIKDGQCCECTIMKQWRFFVFFFVCARFVVSDCVFFFNTFLFRYNVGNCATTNHSVLYLRKGCTIFYILLTRYTYVNVKGLPRLLRSKELTCRTNRTTCCVY